MAKITFDGFDEYAEQLKKLEVNTLSVIKPAVYDGAAVVADEVKRHLRRVVSSRATGDLERSLGLSPMQDSFGFIHTKLGFDGYDRKGAANAPKAYVLERGRRDQPGRRKKPFIRPSEARQLHTILVSLMRTLLCS